MTQRSAFRVLTALVATLVACAGLAGLTPARMLAHAQSATLAAGSNSPEVPNNCNFSFLHGDDNNTCDGITTFSTSSSNATGGWQFYSTGTGSGRAVKAECHGDPGCQGLAAIGHRYGLYAESQTSDATHESHAVMAVGHGIHPTEGAAIYGYNANTQPNSFAPGIEGVAEGAQGTGVIGRAARIGVMGYTTNTSPALIAFGGVFSASLGTGVYAVSKNGFGLRAETTGNSLTYAGIFTATNGSGLLATSTNVNSSNTAAGVIGQSSAGRGSGVVGIANKYGVHGIGNGAASYGGYFSSTAGIGLSATSVDNFALYGFSNNLYGITGGSSSAIGVRATSNSGVGLFVDSSTNIGAKLSTETGPAALRATHGNPGPGKFGIISDGDVLVNGSLSCTGSCLAMSAATSSGDRLVYAEGATTKRVSDEGAARLKDGRAVISIDPLFAQTVNLNEQYMVVVVPNSADTLGLAVVNKGATSFEVRELGNGQGSFTFDWRISAVRKGQEKERLAPAPMVPAAERLEDQFTK